jgi:hypothetical protein
VIENFADNLFAKNARVQRRSMTSSRRSAAHNISSDSTAELIPLDAMDG